jgi:hypothetical protein
MNRRASELEEYGLRWTLCFYCVKFIYPPSVAVFTDTCV